MSMFSNSLKKAKSQVSKLKSDKKGVAGIEFAFIAPIFILLFLGTLEISLAVAVDRKVSRISSAVGDLVAQFDGDITRSDIDDILDIAERIMYPYDDPLGIVVSGVSISGGNATVSWSHAVGSASANASGSPISIPNSIRTDGSFLIVSEVVTTHAPAFKFINYANGKLTFDGNAVQLSEIMYLRSRSGSAQTCNTC